MSLTPREKEIVARLMTGEPRKVMADEMGIVPRTVYRHLANLRRKLRVGSTVQVAVFFARQTVSF